jgi:hypothetical protein
MRLPTSPAPLGRLAQREARLVLGAWAAVSMLLVGVTVSPRASGFAHLADRGPGDVDLYRAEVERIRAGEGYYQAASAELHARGYPTRSVFNWRTPLPMWLVGTLAHPGGTIVLGALALAVLLLGFELTAREAGVRAAALCGLLAIGPLVLCVLGDLAVMPELWSGVLVALSTCAYGLGRRGWGLAAGVMALFFRELAAPYCLLGLGLALYERRRGEALGWVAGLAAYAAFFAVHAATVHDLVGPGERAHAEGWVQFGGAAFVLSTCQMSAWLLVLPQWVTALYVAAAILGFSAWRGPVALRVGLTVALYFLAFAVVGQPFNQYWGSMFAPLVAFGACRAPGALADLWRRAGVTTFDGYRPAASRGVARSWPD